MTTEKERKESKILNSIYSKKSDFWMKKRDEHLLHLFRKVVREVPSYLKFLQKNYLNPESIKSFHDFNYKVPALTKDNYLRKYAWQELCKINSLSKDSLVLTSTSGSTGKPFYFPRNGILDQNSSIFHELFLKNSKIDSSKSTLVVVCFGMGVWIGGIITYQAFKKISDRGFPMAIITPGVNKKEIYEALKNLAPKFDQVILCGYPPFMKDLIDEAPDNGVNLKSINLKIIFAAEAFSESFRDYIAKKTGIKNIYRDTMNIYGSADLGTMAVETPLCVLVRRLAIKNKKIYEKLFEDARRLPTLAQFIPGFTNFEAVNKEIYCSGDNVLPLLRYKIGDNGGVFSFEYLGDIFKREGVDLKKEIKKAKLEDSISELPFVYVYERTDFSTKLYGAIIYPEYIKEGLLNKNLEAYITSKFNIYTRHDKKQNEYLEINIELKDKVKVTKRLIRMTTKFIVNSLLDKSAEYKYLSGTLSERIKPRLVFWPYNHPLYFGGGTKQKWVKKD